VRRALEIGPGKRPADIVQRTSVPSTATGCSDSGTESDAAWLTTWQGTTTNSVEQCCAAASKPGAPVPRNGMSRGWLAKSQVKPGPAAAFSRSPVGNLRQGR